MKETSTSILGIYNGQQCVGFPLKRGKAGVEALDADCISLGLLSTEHAEADAVSRAAALKAEAES